MIVLNSLSLCLYDYSARLPNSEEKTINWIIDQSEYLFTSVFLLEAVLKIIGMGFMFGIGSYLLDYWNIFDFIIILSG